MQNPVDQNFLNGNSFQLTFGRLPYIQFFLQQINLPGITTNPILQTTPFIDRHLPPNKMEYEAFEMTFAVDEALWTFTSLSDWLKGMTIPDNFQEYKNLSLQQQLIAKNSNQTPQYSDGTLTIFTNKNNPICTVLFSDMFPISLSGIQFNVSDSAQTIKTCKAAFQFTTYTISRSV